MAKKGKNITPEDVTGPKPNPAWTWLATIGLLLVAAGTLMPILGSHDIIYRELPSTFKYIYTGGAALLLISRLFNGYKGVVLRVKRLRRIETWSALFFCVGAFFLFYETDTTRNWLAFTLAGAAIQVYVSFMLPRTMRRALNGEVE